VPYRLALRFLGVIALAIGTLPAFAQEFSAELVHLKPPSDLKSKVFVRGEKMRFEIVGQKRTSVAIIDVATRVSLMMIPDNKTYVKSINAHAAIPLFQVTNPEDACAAWEKSTEKPGTCTKVGDDTISGRSAVKYKGTSDDGETGYVWVDRKLKSVIKWEGENTATELQNILEGPQEATLFQVPQGYEMFDLAAAQQAAKGKNKLKAPPQKARTPAQ
jgi:hypothetical protein